MLLLGTIISFLCLSVVGYLFLRDPGRKVYIALSAVVLSGVMWSFFINAQGIQHSTVASLWLIRLAFVFATLLALSMYFFSGSLIQEANKAKTRYYIAVPIALVGIAVSLSPYVISAMSLSSGRPIAARGSAYLVSVSIIIGLAATAVARLVKYGYREEGYIHKQLMLSAYGLAAGLLVGVMTNVILPNVLGTTQPSRYAFVSICIWTGVLVYTVSRHGFLDMRPSIVRALAYSTAISCFAVIYGAFVSLTFEKFLNIDLSILKGVVISVLVTAGAISFAPLVKLFDRVTRKVFLRNQYDSTNVLNDLNSILVANLNLQEIVDNVASKLMTATNVDLVGFALNNGTISDTLQDHLKPEGIKYILGSMSKHSQKTTSLDLLRFFTTADYRINVVVRLSVKDEFIGAVIIGDKNEGLAINSADIRFFEIVSDNVAIAVQNAMRFQEIQNFNETLQEHIDVATKKLRATNEKLRVLDQTKDDFISMSSHQLRTPLTAVKGYISMVLEGDVGAISPMQRKLLNQAFVSSQRMVYLISDFLNVSRLRTGKFVLESSPTNLASMAKEEISQLRETAKARGLNLELIMPETFPTVLLDNTKMRQVIMNFVDNAIYYTPADGHIVIKLEDKPNSIEFTVTDNGIGVPKGEQFHLFTKFYRAPNARKMRPDGTGLGLFMAKKVVAAQGGTIIFKSSEGKGSKFGFSFLKDRLHLAEE